MDTEQRLQEIRKRLKESLEPVSLQVEDEGHLHVGHEGARDGRGHFRVLVIAQCFEGLSALKRHRMIYEAMGVLMQTDIHALTIDAYAPDEF
jgi:BolA protein